MIPGASQPGTRTCSYYIPPISETLAHFTMLGNVECAAVLALRMLGRTDTGTIDCGNGISSAEKIAGTQINGSAKQILRTSHEAAINIALLKGNNDVALALLQGLTVRVETDLGAMESSNPPANVNKKDVAALLLHAANAGVPLTSHEVRWLHQRIHEAFVAYRDPSMATAYRVFDPATPDGTYPYQPEGDGLAFSDLGVLLGRLRVAVPKSFNSPCARLRQAAHRSLNSAKVRRLVVAPRAWILCGQREGPSGCHR